MFHVFFTFGTEWGKAIHCNIHRVEGEEDVKHERCKFPGCKTLASYGYLFHKKDRCGVHKEGRVLLNNPKCEECRTHKPFWTDDETNIPKRCDDHQKPGDKNIVEKPCSRCGLEEFINETNQLCTNCDRFINVKVRKEIIIKNLFGENAIKYTRWDKKIPEGCSSRRPDCFIEGTETNIIVEIDENQHKNYAPECEIIRMKQLFFDIGTEQGLYVIRYNPDEFKRHGEDTDVKPSKRQKRLFQMIRWCQEKPITNKIVVKYLFYDDTHIKEETIDPY